MSTNANIPDWENKLAKLPLAAGGFSKEMMQQVKERTAMKQEKKFKPLRMALIALAAIVCSAGIWQHERIGEAVGAMFSSLDKTKLKPMDKNADVTLKVFTPYGDQFIDQYGRSFMIRNPNVIINPIFPSPSDIPDVSSMTHQQLEDWLEKGLPDVMELTPAQYELLSKAGKLYDLEAVIKQDAFDLEGFQPSVIRALRDLSDGRLYGLAPRVSTDALFYNKDLFDQYGVDYPTDNMSWDEVLQLAARFPTEGQGDNRVYGLDASNGAFELIYQIGSTLGLRMTNQEGTATTLDSKSWSNLWSKVTEGFRKGYITQANQVEGSVPMSNYAKNHPYLSGRAAMTFGTNGIIDHLDEAKKAGLQPFRWDVATEPVDPENRNQATTFRMGTIYAVNAKSGNLRAAWELVKLVNSPESARKEARSKLYTPLLTRTAFQLSDGEHHFGAFFKLEPNVRQMTEKWNGSLYAIAKSEADALIRGDKTLEQALADAAEQGDRLLKGKP